LAWNTVIRIHLVALKVSGKGPVKKRKCYRCFLHFEMKYCFENVNRCGNVTYRISMTRLEGDSQEQPDQI